MTSDTQNSWIYGSAMDESSCHQILNHHQNPFLYGQEQDFPIHLTDNPSVSGSYYSQSPTCPLIQDSSSVPASHFTYSQSSESSWSHQHYQQSQTIQRSSSHDSYSCTASTSSVILDHAEDSNHSQISSSIPSCSRNSPELQRAVVKLSEIMAARAKAESTDQTRCMIRFAVDDVLPLIHIKRRRFYVISNVLSAIGRLTHSKQKNLLWRHSDDAVHNALSQLYVEAKKYVNIGRLAHIMGSPPSAARLVSLDDRSIIDIPGDGRGLLNFDDLKQPSWIVENTRKSQLSSTQRLLMLCLMNGTNNAIAFTMDRQVYDICRVLIAVGILAEVSPGHNSVSRRVLYRYAGPDINALSNSFPCQPCRVVSTHRKRPEQQQQATVAAPSSPPLLVPSPHESSGPTPRLHVASLEPVDVNIDGEVISKNKVSRILHQLGVYNGCGVSVSVSGGSSSPPSTRRRQSHLLSLVEHRLSPNSYLPPTISPPGKRKRKFSSTGATACDHDNWRQLRLDECAPTLPPSSNSNNFWFTSQDEDFLLDAVSDFTGFFNDQTEDSLPTEILDFAVCKEEMVPLPPLKRGGLQNLPVNVVTSVSSSMMPSMFEKMGEHSNYLQHEHQHKENKPFYVL